VRLPIIRGVYHDPGRRGTRVQGGQGSLNSNKFQVPINRNQKKTTDQPLSFLHSSIYLVHTIPPMPTASNFVTAKYFWHNDRSHCQVLFRMLCVYLCLCSLLLELRPCPTLFKKKENVV